MRCRTSQQPYPIYTTVLCCPKPETPPGTTRTKLIQTMFRESEAQTEPYVVDIPDNVDKGLEILTLGWLSWNNGLPAGMNEIMTIERARQKRAWEAALPIPLDQTSMELRRMIIEAIEINEWKYREEVMTAMNSIRMELAKKVMKEKCKKNKEKYELRINNYIDIKKSDKNKKIFKLRLAFNRQMRKLISNKNKINFKYHRSDIITQFTSKTSELYAPQLRFGEDPRNWHEKIPFNFQFYSVFNKLEVMHQTLADVPFSLLPAFDFKNKSKPKDKNVKDLCIRLTKWTEQNLETLYDELKSIRWKRYNTPKPCYLKKKIPVMVTDSEIPSVTGVSDDEEDMFQACLFLQKTIKGRAIQAVMFEGRVKCQELIEELKSTHALQSHKEDEKGQLRRKIYGLQRQAEIELMQEKKKNEILAALEGKTTGEMLDFLSKELLRLQNERQTHALALLADQERHKREAMEAGRRQLEEQRKREHEEMFKQIIKLHQNSVRSFLEEVFDESQSWVSQRNAREYVTDLAKKIDQAAMATTMVPIFTRCDDLIEEEIIADLVHNFALPEAEKRIVRQRMNAKQRNYLKVCHDEVYSNIEKITQGKRTEKGQLIPLPRSDVHKIPPQVRVKYRHLKRTHDTSSSTLNSMLSAGSVVDEQFMATYKMNAEQKQIAEREMWSSGFSRQEVILKNDKVDDDDDVQ
ncbi:conserved hypothetical protein [Pediculus humanus corporis]|uniref:Cilia- and flagella-associated protein 91 n=1 Tax=Pediculus humanus subsp. corporis TaxID=121224 RepID=E0W2Y9_PEDHC|nr:uncharacterized protein Phum_PHUM599350 [Pediculus humanus corporis]EEB19995.1 conserved hypothetical protein [Pediculus humanus corporis]